MRERLGEIPFNNDLSRGREGYRETMHLGIIAVTLFCVAIVLGYEALYFLSIAFIISAAIRAITANFLYMRGAKTVREDLKRLGLRDVENAGDGFLATHNGRKVEIHIEQGRNDRYDILIDQID